MWPPLVFFQTGESKMSIYQQIAELRAELAGCILTKTERAETKAQLEAAIAQAATISGETEKAVPQ
jgi:hypothetical protein